MKKNTKIIVSMGVIASVITPIAIVAASAINTNEVKNKATANSFKQSNFGLNSLTTYTNPTFKTPKAPEVKPPIDVIDGSKAMAKFIKEIDGTTYMGTTNDGLMKIENGKLVPAATTKNGVADKTGVDHGFIEKINGVTYVGTQDGLKILENGKLKPILGVDGITIDTRTVVGGFMKEINGVVYVGTTKEGLMKMEKGILVPAVFKTPASNKPSSKAQEDKTSVEGGFIKEINKTIYVGTHASGLMKIEKETLVPALTDANGTVDRTSMNGGFIKVLNGITYVGTYDHGLMKIENDKLVPVVSVADGNSPTSVAGGFMEEIDGTIYVGNLGKGLRILENNKLITIDGDNPYTFIKKINGGIHVGLDSSSKTNTQGLAKLDFSKAAKINQDFIQGLFGRVKIQNQDSKSIEEVSKEIKDVASLEKYAGIKVPKMRYSTLGKVRASYDSKNKTIHVEIEVKTMFQNNKIINGYMSDKIENIVVNPSDAVSASQDNNKGFIALLIITVLAGLSMISGAIVLLKSKILTLNTN